MLDPYTITVHHEAGTMWADSPDLPGMHAAGDDPGELAESVAEGVAIYLAED